MNHLQAGVEFAFTVLPESSALVEPGEGSLDDPSLGHNGKGVQLASFRDLDVCLELFAHRVGEQFSAVAAIGQDAGDLVQGAGAAIERGQRAVAVRHLGRRDGDRVRQPLRIDRDVALDAGYALAGVIPLLPGRVGVLHALRVDDQEARRAAPPLSGAVLAN